MINEQTIVERVNTALKAHDNYVRKEAEMNILQMRDANPTQFFTLATIIIAKEQYSVDVRQSVGTVTSRLLALKANDGSSYWDQVHNSNKGTIKENALGVLISKDMEVMKAGAQIIANIVAIELPRGQWEEIIDILAENCMTSDFSIRNASLTTLGFICQKIKAQKKEINHRLCEQILGCLILGIKDQNEVFIKTSLQALSNSLSFLQKLLQSANYRDTVFQQLINKFQHESKYSNLIYNVLFEFVKVASPFLPSYKDKILQLSQRHIEQRNSNAVLNLQLWNVIGSDYSDKVNRGKDRMVEQNFKGPNFMQMVASDILPLAMNCMVIMNKAESQDDELKDAATRAVSSFAQNCDRNVINIITDSVAKIIDLENPDHLQATVPLFSCISDYDDEIFVRESFTNGFDHLFKLMRSNSKVVVKNTLLGFERLSQNFPQVFLQRGNVAEVMGVLFEFVEVDFIEVQTSASQIISNITQGLKDVPDPVSNDPNILLTRAVKFFTQNMVRLHSGEGRPINQRLTIIIINIVMSTDKRDIIEQLIEFMILEYYKVYNLNINDSQILIQEILSVLHTSILAYKNSVPNIKTLQSLCQLVDKHIHRFGVEQQGLNLLGSIATTFNKSFLTRSENYWKHVMHGFESVNDIATFKAALSCIGDFARMSETDFLNHSGDIMGRLLKQIKNSMDREVKINIISCMGDLTLSMQEYAETFLDEIMDICQECFQAIYEITSNPNEVDDDYIDELKTTLIEMYACVVFAVHNKKNPNPRTFDRYEYLATFVVRTCDISVKPTIDYIVACLYLIYDSAAFYWRNERFRDRTTKIVNSEEIGKLVDSIKKYSDKENVKQLIGFINSKRTA